MKVVRQINPLKRLGVALALIALCAACDDSTDPFTDAQIEARYGGPPTTTHVEEFVAFTDEPYSFTGDSSIQELLDVIPDAPVYYGYAPGDEFPTDEPCEGRFDNIFEASELPMVVEGVVTLHPRFFIKPEFCGEDERYYGSYFIQDSSGGIMVFRDSRIADFMMGDRVRIRVRGLFKSFDTRTVLAHDPAEIVSTGNPIYYEEIDRELDLSDIGKVRRFTGKVAGLPTNSNFNEMCLVRPEDDSDEECAKYCEINTAEADCLSGVCVPDFNGASSGRCERDGGYWLVSLDREIGQRQPRIIEKGDIIEVTGPIFDSFGIKFLVARWGQFRFID